MWILQYRVKAGCLSVKRIFVAAGYQRIGAYPQPGKIPRQLGSGKARADGLFLLRNRISIIRAERRVKRRCEIPYAKVPVAIDAQVGNTIVVRSHIADDCGPNQKTVGIVVVAPRFTIDIVNNCRLGRVANNGEILFV